MTKLSKESSDLPWPKERGSVCGRLGETNEVQSSIPSHIKCFSTLDVKAYGSLRVKRCTMVLTSHRSNPTPNMEVMQEEQASSNHIIV